MVLPRTGSCEHALSKSRKTGEYLWFSLGDNAPGGTISAERATHEIVTATRRGETERILSVPANLLARLHGLAPSATGGLLTLVNNLFLPAPTDAPDGLVTSQGKEVAPDVPARPLFEAATGLGRAAAERLNQNTES